MTQCVKRPKIKILIASIVLLITFNSESISQTLDDALRYSIQNYNASSRFLGVGGSFNALGADVSVASTNPAGIAEFRKSEISATLLSMNSTNESTYNGVMTEDQVSQFGVGNATLVLHYDPPSFNVRTFNLAIGFNQLANFKETLVYQGDGSGSIVERFLEVAEGNTPDELDAFEGGPAFDAGAIFNFDGGTTYFSDFDNFNQSISRTETIERSGTLNEFFLAVGSNVNNKFSWGATLGFPFASFSETKRYTESDNTESVPTFDNLNYDQILNTSGVGFNVKLGIIYKITPRFRLGAAIHSKSFYFLTDEFETSASYSFTEDGNSETLSAQSPFSEFEYQFDSPWRAIGGLGYLYSAGDLKGFLSAEVEYVDYTSGSFNLTANSNDPIDQFFEDDLNAEIDDVLTNALNYRVGTELAYKKGRGRLGVVLPSSPFANSNAWNFDPVYNAGIGYRGNRIYVDAAVSYRPSTTNYTSYRLIEPSNEPFVEIDSRRLLLSFTVGFKL